MAGLYVCYNFFFSTGEDKLARRAYTKGNGISTPTSTLFRALTSTSASTFALVLGLLGKYINEDLQKVFKLALELFI